MKNTNKLAENIARIITRESFSLADIVIGIGMIRMFDFPWIIFTWVGWIFFENVVRMILAEKDFQQAMSKLREIIKKGGKNDNS